MDRHIRRTIWLLDDPGGLFSQGHNKSVITLELHLNMVPNSMGSTYYNVKDVQFILGLSTSTRLTG